MNRLHPSEWSYRVTSLKRRLEGPRRFEIVFTSCSNRRFDENEMILLKGRPLGYVGEPFVFSDDGTMSEWKVRKEVVLVVGRVYG